MPNGDPTDHGLVRADLYLGNVLDCDGEGRPIDSESGPGVTTP
jgi:hypothetical protein